MSDERRERIDRVERIDAIRQRWRDHGSQPPMSAKSDIDYLLDLLSSSLQGSRQQKCTCDSGLGQDPHKSHCEAIASQGSRAPQEVRPNELQQRASDVYKQLAQHSVWNNCACQSHEECYEAKIRILAVALAASPSAGRQPEGEQCICAAIQLPNGEVWRGHRHDSAILTASKAPDVTREAIHEAEQGFITSRNRFVGRGEGAELQRRAGIVSAQNLQPVTGPLFSEDLYLRDWRSPAALRVERSAVSQPETGEIASQGSRAPQEAAMIADMQAASDAVDEAAGTSEYAPRMIALALIARHFLRERLAASPSAGRQPEGEKEKDLGSQR